MALYVLETSHQAAEPMARQLGLPLSACEVREFEDGEFKVRALEAVGREQVFVLQWLYGDAQLSLNDRLMRLLVFIGSLKDAGAAEVIALLPYLAYARKDRRTQPRDPVTTRYLGAMFEAVGLDGIVTVDVHSPSAFDNAFRCPKLNLEAAPLFVGHFRALGEGGAPLVVLSPDAGGIKRARGFADLLEAEVQRPVTLAFVEKQRAHGQVSGQAFAGDVDGATVIIYDDMISSGTTLARAARACRERGAAAVHAAATHGIFARGADTTLAQAGLDSLVVTDTIPAPRERCPGLALEVLGCAPLFAGAIRQLAPSAGR